MPRQACCGALSAHAGRTAEAERLTERLRNDLSGFDVIAVNAAGCGSHLKDARPRPPSTSRSCSRSVRAARLHPLAGCASRTRTPATSGTLRRLPAAYRASLGRIPALEVVETAEQDVCCGSAGIYNVLQPERCRELGERKAGHVLASSAQAFTSANPGCLVQISQALRRARRPLPALHPIELLDASIRNIGAARLLTGARR